MPSFKSRRGSQIVEATMVLPVTVFVTVALIGLVMSFHFQLLRQIEEHSADRQQLYLVQETAALRILDSLSDTEGGSRGGEVAS